MLTAKPYHWYCLLAAIALEVGGTIIMKLAQGWTFVHAQTLGLAVMWMAIGLSYFLLSKAVTGIPVGVTFAFWEGLGLTCITLGGILFLGEALTLRRAVGIFCVLAGAQLVNCGTDQGGGRNAGQAPGHGAALPDAPNDNETRCGLPAPNKEQRHGQATLHEGIATQGGGR